MKIALCFYGLIGSKTNKNGIGENLDPKIAYNYYKKNIINVNKNVDIFVHSWSIEAKNKILQLYKPKKYIIEEQIDFSYSKNHPKKFGNFRNRFKYKLLKFFKRNKYEKLIKKKNKKLFRAYSRWYSNKKVIDLKIEYEKENNFKYDMVMVTRLDIGFFKKLNFKNFDNNFFYVSHRNDAPTRYNNYVANYENHQLGISFQDLWFFSNDENIDNFGKLFDNIEEYDVSPHSSSLQHVYKFIGNQKVKFVLYRWFDYELIRRKIFKSEN